MQIPDPDQGALKSLEKEKLEYFFKISLLKCEGLKQALIYYQFFGDIH